MGHRVIGIDFEVLIGLHRENMRYILASLLIETHAAARMADSLSLAK